jgi:crotonobetainyl-CoA:carnitine CoA-transferase CaiB-like acyl-CoA transferase
MFETMVGFVLGDHLGGLSFEPPLDEGGYARQLSPERRPYRTADGHLCALVYTDKQWEGFLEAVGRQSLLQDDPRFATFAARSRHIDHVYGWLAPRSSRQRSTADWMVLLAGCRRALHADARPATASWPTRTSWPPGSSRPCEHPSEGTIRSMRMAMSWQRPVRRDRCGWRRDWASTAVEVLREAGFAAAEIEQLLAAGAARGAAQAGA